MSTYEINDEIVRGLVDNADLLPPRLHDAMLMLEEQIPVPVPTKLAAVVRTDQNNCFIRWAYDAHTHEPWIAHSSVDETYRTDQIGRIVAVLSEGVDL